MTAPIVFSACEHGRTLISCNDCALRRAEERWTGAAQEASYTRVEEDTFVPDPLVDTRATFYPAGSLVPSDLLPSKTDEVRRPRRRRTSS